MNNVVEWVSQLKSGDLLVNFYCLNPEDEEAPLGRPFAREHVRFVSFDNETELITVQRVKDGKFFNRKRFFLSYCKCGGKYLEHY